MFANESDCKTLIAEQKADATLDPYCHMASKNKGHMFVENGILYHCDEVCRHKVKQLCIPHGRRMQAMHLVHDSVLAGHLRNQKTSERIRLNFFWPNMKHDILSYTSSCQPCQLRTHAKRTDRDPITPIVRPTVPFTVCHADIIDPIEPPSAKGHKWALCIIDDCTCWPAVYLLRSITAKATYDAFIDLFSITEWPEILCTDQGTNFCSRLTQEFLTHMGVSPLIHTSHHPEVSGVIKRYNALFKNMLHHAIRDYGRQWHRVVPCLVWAIREIPNWTTSVAPHFLLFGQVPMGPRSILRESWEGRREADTEASQPVNQYVADLEQNMRNAKKYAREHSIIEQERYAKHYNDHAKDKSFQTGEQVVILEKDSSHKPFVHWKQGKILRVHSPYSYDVGLSDG